MHSVDVVISFYRGFEDWQYVIAGLDDNRELINRLIICNDELWNGRRLDTKDYRVIYLDHPHNGFGAQRSFNQGLAAVETEYFVHIDDDMVLTEGAIAANLDGIEEDTLVCGLIDCIDADGNLLRDEYRVPAIPIHLLMRHGHIVVPTEFCRSIGGIDEKYKGYGLWDYDFAYRWELNGGTVCLGNGKAHHIDGIDDPNNRPAWKTPADASWELLDKTRKRHNEFMC